MSVRSTPPILLLYSMTIFGHAISFFSLPWLTHLYKVSIGSMQRNLKQAAQLSIHLTMKILVFINSIDVRCSAFLVHSFVLFKREALQEICPNCPYSQNSSFFYIDQKVYSGKLIVKKELVSYITFACSHKRATTCAHFWT